MLFDTARLHVHNVSTENSEGSDTRRIRLVSLCSRKPLFLPGLAIYARFISGSTSPDRPVPAVWSRPPRRAEINELMSSTALNNYRHNLGADAERLLVE
ncbi:hypothetical protein SSP531S_29840 [Streptomyces spongiicola]|uniref:Uncharacterized protein n=1 Tax=Streptomyces spongiicola TaxID=1690221 RepID=A0A388T2W2_9ACTN|nr:hypothetical protein SSP531S_29840 [Streptomyces spongiicola]